MVYLNKEKYLEMMIEKYSDMVYRLALTRTKSKENSEDVYQDVFFRLSRKMPDFESEEHEKAWLIKVTINCSKNVLNSAFLRHTTEMKDEIIFETYEDNEGRIVGLFIRFDLNKMEIFIFLIIMI